MRKLLLLEDDTALGEGIHLALKSGETKITLCRTLSEGRLALEQDVFDLLILDINLPDGNGLELLREVRQSSTVPVILLTANDMETDIVNGLEPCRRLHHPSPFLWRWLGKGEYPTAAGPQRSRQAWWR